MMLWKGSSFLSLVDSVTGWKQPMALARHDHFERVADGVLDQIYFSTLGYQRGSEAESTPK